MATQTYTNLNAELNLYSPEGKLQLHKDKEAAKAYFNEHVNVHTRFFHDLEEKVEYLTTHSFWNKETLKPYDFAFIKKAFKHAYEYKFRFPTFMSAYKFYSSYALKSDDGKTILERYEDRVVMTALHLAQGNKALALGIIDEVITGRYQPATPTFQNAGKARGGEMVSCFLLRAEDSLDSLQDTWKAAAQLSKIGGGVAINLTNIRERGAPLKGKEGLAKGVISWMKIYEDIFSTVDQLGTRPGAGAVYLSAHHPDIELFLDCKRENADEKIRIKTLSTGVVIPDITIELARKGEDMYLFSPYDVKRVYGIPLDEIDLTARYTELVNNAEIKKSKISARKFLQTLAELQFESGYPYILFSVNAYRGNPVAGNISMSNLCVTGDTELMTDSGPRKMDDLYRETLKEARQALGSLRVSASDDELVEDYVRLQGVGLNVAVDERAASLSLKEEGVRSARSTKVVRTAREADIYEVKTIEGFSIKATEWHKMYVSREGELVKIPLNEVEEGDKILVQQGEGFFGTIHKPKLAYLAGVIAADGTIVESKTSAGNHTSTARIYLYDKKMQLAEKIEAIVGEVLANSADLVERQATVTPKFRKSKIVERMALHSAPLAKILANEGMTQKTKLTVPEFVLKGDRETQVAYLSGLFQFDGCITGGGPSIELVSINRALLNQLQKMLLNLGVYSRIYAGRKEDGYDFLPGPNGELKEYVQHASNKISIYGKADGQKLYEVLDWAPWQDEAMKRIVRNYRSDKIYKTHSFTARVESITHVGVEAVYDVQCDDGGNSVIFNGIVTGNCSEILQTNTPTTYDEKTGRVKELGRDISCNLGSLNVYEAMKSPDLEKTVDIAMRALTSVSDMTSIDRVPTVKKANELMHSVGLGQMSLATYFATHGMVYGDEDTLEFTRVYFALINYYSLSSSCKIAQETKEKFLGFEDSTYATGEYWERYLEEGNEFLPRGEKVKKLFKKAGISIPGPAEWGDLKRRVQKHGLYHAWRMAVAPTGSISYLANSSPSILPVPAKIEARKEGMLGRVMVLAPHMTDENMQYYKDAYEVGPEGIIGIYAEATKSVDQGLSMTLHYTEGQSTKDVVRSYLMAHKMGVKTSYYMRIRSANTGALSGLDVEGCVSCEL